MIIVSKLTMRFVSLFSGKWNDPYLAVAFLGLPIIIVRSWKDINPVLINHERIHMAQAHELFYIGFWLMYVYYHIKYGYWDNPFEKEAYEHEEDMSYLEYREPYRWLYVSK